MTRHALLLLTLFVAFAGCAARNAPSESRSELISAEEARSLAIAYREGMGAYVGRDLAGATKALSRALELNPGADSLVYTLGALAAEAGRTDDAYGHLERLVAMRSDLVPVAGDFPGLSAERLERIGKTLARNGPPHGKVAFTLDERSLIPEGIAHDPTTGTFFVGSIRKRKVVAVRPDGRVADFVGPRAHGLLAALGMKVDSQRRHLWVASYASPTMEGYTAEDSGRSTLFRFDADTGELLARYPRRTPGKHLLNDMVVDANGNVYVTDSEAGEVLRLRAHAAEGDSFEVFIPAGELFYPNGIALSADGRRLYVADAAQGLTVAEVDTGARAIVRHPRGVTTRDIDGMYFRDGTLIAVQNGTGVGRVTRLVLSPDGDAVVRAEVLEANHPSFIIPTTGAIANDALYVLANAQLRSFDADGKIWPPEKLHPVQIVRVPLR